MSIIEQAKSLLEEQYKRIWKDWYSNLDITPAEFIVEEKMHSSGYKKDEDKLFLFLPEANLEDVVHDLGEHDIPCLSSHNWSLWKRELVHEMLHEYQFKVIQDNVTNEGCELYKVHGKPFYGPGHGQDFFSAIADRAPYFEMQPEELMNNL